MNLTQDQFLTENAHQYNSCCLIKCSRQKMHVNTILAIFYKCTKKIHYHNCSTPLTSISKTSQMRKWFRALQTQQCCLQTTRGWYITYY